MSLLLEISADLERRLKAEAARYGMGEADFARQILETNLPLTSPAVDQVTLDLLAQWDREDATDDVEELARRNREFEELKAALNRNRLEAGGPDARAVFP